MNSQEIVDYVMNTPNNTNPAILKQMIDGVSNGGASSWNDLTDKPFYDTERRDTFKWEKPSGITSDDFIWLSDTYKALKASDVTPTAEELANGYTTICEYEGSVDYTRMEVGDGYIDCNGFIIVFEDNCIFRHPDYSDTIFPEKGLYICWGEESGYAPHTIIIPGYTGFPPIPAVKPLDTKYLPEAMQFGEIMSGGDVWEWSADDVYNDWVDVSVILSDGQFLCKVSDAVVTAKDIENGFYFNYYNGDKQWDGVEMEGDNYTVCANFVFATEDDCEAEIHGGTYTLPEKGMYVFAGDSEDTTPFRIRIEGFTGFPPRKEHKRLDTKFMPYLYDEDGGMWELYVTWDGEVKTRRVDLV